MTTHYTHIKRYKRGAHWPTGEPRMCVRCRANGRPRANVAVVTAVSKSDKDSFKMPVGYCQEHIPDELRSKDDQVPQEAS